MGVTKLRLAANSTARAKGSSGRPRLCAIPREIGVPMTAAALLETRIFGVRIFGVRVKILEVRPELLFDFTPTPIIRP